jgi:hypothetical protein
MFVSGAVVACLTAVSAKLPIAARGEDDPCANFPGNRTPVATGEDDPWCVPRATNFVSVAPGEVVSVRVIPGDNWLEPGGAVDACNALLGVSTNDFVGVVVVCRVAGASCNVFVATGDVLPA